MKLDTWRKGGTFFRYNDHRIFYRDEGSGEVVLCIHGFPTASWDWSWIWVELTKRYRAVAPDMIGFGLSDKPTDYVYSLHDQATLIEQLLVHLNITDCHILAHDYGDTVAQELLARFHEHDEAGALQLRSVCLLNGGIIPGAHRPRLIQRLLIGPLGPLVGRLTNARAFNRSFREVFAPETQPSEEDLQEYWRLITYNDGRRVMHKVIRYMRERENFKLRWVGALQQSRVPLRFINGTADPVSGRHMAEQYHRLVPNPDVVLLEDVGHYPQVEAPEATLNAFFEFQTRVA